MVASSNNISVSPELLTCILNADGRLAQKEPTVWICVNQNEVHVYRKSTKAPRKYSRERYELSSMKNLGKDKRKYDLPPLVPTGGYEYRIKNMTVSTITEMDVSYLEELVGKVLRIHDKS